MRRTPVAVAVTAAAASLASPALAVEPISQPERPGCAADAQRVQPPNTEFGIGIAPTSLRLFCTPDRVS